VRWGDSKRAIHSLVAEAFIGARPEGLEVAHLNGDCRDNRACNLQYCTHRDNEAMKAAHGRIAKGEMRPGSKLTDAEAALILSELGELPKGKCGGKARELAKRFGVSEATISLVRHGKKWRHVRLPVADSMRARSS
jgi:hypothetical protein